MERQLGIIVEAVNNFIRHSSNEPLDNSKQIIGFRNRLIRAYDNIDKSIVWVSIKRYWPALRISVLEKL